MKQLFLLTTVLLAINIASVDCKLTKVKILSYQLRQGNFVLHTLYLECVEVGSRDVL